MLALLAGLELIVAKRSQSITQMKDVSARALLAIFKSSILFIVNKQE